jgi:hypothetical protein
VTGSDDRFLGDDIAGGAVLEAPAQAELRPICAGLSLASKGFCSGLEPPPEKTNGQDGKDQETSGDLLPVEIPADQEKSIGQDS